MFRLGSMISKPTSKREENRARQRQAILTAATDLFAAQGFDGVTMADIAAKAGVVRATVFNYFPSKHSLIEAITEGVFNYYNAIVERALEEEATPVPALAKTLLVHMGEGIEYTREFYRGVFREMLRMRSGLVESDAIAAVRHGAQERLEELMRRGQSRGEIRNDVSAADLARSFDALSLGTILDWLYEREEDSLRERMETTARVFLSGAGCPVAADIPLVPGLLPLAETPTGPGLLDVEDLQRAR